MKKNLQETVNELMQIKGNVRGDALRVDLLYILEKKGEKGLRAVEDKLAELGYSIKLKEIERLRWYPEAQSVLIVLVAQELFNWTNDDIFFMGNDTPKFSFIAKVLIRYLVSVERIFKAAPIFWRKHFDFGSLDPIEFNEKEGSGILRVSGYKFLPFMCDYQAGYLLRFGQLSIGSKEITIKEIKCVFKGDPYNEYLLKWK